ncbi:hypothetical protein SHI21_18355 [Bacteriovorax sp. PP10]|uniref:Enolase C-terminal domain-containing protein n=1 Tax=Bacteriovorax antarcticus TaxID=3088717 RepID=A0ABU5VYR5_9BACT|nr:hypothetical protein [Bacteriovorax sp. PP10]MEA9358203.1 hypothetical protein [Bacteriovorax sp. PP10]
MIDIKTSFETIKYRSPVPVRGVAIDSNRFLKVRVLERDYYLSVLPGLHNVTIEELDFKVKYFFSHYDLDFKSIDFSVKFFNLVHLKDVFLDSIKEETLFNIEAILLGMIKTTHPHLFSHDSIAINLLYNDKDGAEFYLDADCVKIKIAPGRVDHTIKTINELYKINPEMIYRLDGNKRFELNELIEFEHALKNGISSVAFSKIDYIEEPFKNFYDTTIFTKRSHLLIAIDESYKNYMGVQDLFYPAVIKPSLIGISPVYSWLGSHMENRAIISSSFEHPTVLVSLQFLAALRPNEFHGLENFLPKL